MLQFKYWEHMKVVLLKNVSIDVLKGVIKFKLICGFRTF